MPRQMVLIGAQQSPPAIIKGALSERPSALIRNATWRIGNITEVPNDGVYFIIGREAPTTVGTVDSEGDFQDAIAMVAPNTHVVLDLKYQVVAVANNSDLTQVPKSVAHNLQKLLESSRTVLDSRCKISLEQIHGPKGFIEALEKAEAITKFQVTYGLPNVWDVERDFQKPIQETTKEMGAEEGTATFTGQDLDRSSVIKLARASAAIGKRARAWIRKTKGERPLRISQDSNPVVFQESLGHEDGESQAVTLGRSVIARIRALYENIRKGD